MRRGERNFHVFYYLYDGLERDGRLHEFHLDADLRAHHAFLAGDRTDLLTKQVRSVSIGRRQAAGGSRLQSVGSPSDLR